MRLGHAFSFVFGVKLRKLRILCFMAFCTGLYMLSSFGYFYKPGSCVIYLVSSGFRFCNRLLDLLQLYSSSLIFWVSSHSSCKFPRLSRFPVFLHSSCSVVLCYLMFIPAGVCNVAISS